MYNVLLQTHKHVQGLHRVVSGLYFEVAPIRVHLKILSKLLLKQIVRTNLSGTFYQFKDPDDYFAKCVTIASGLFIPILLK